MFLNTILLGIHNNNSLYNWRYFFNVFHEREGKREAGETRQTRYGGSRRKQISLLSNVAHVWRSSLPSRLPSLSWKTRKNNAVRVGSRAIMSAGWNNKSPWDQTLNAYIIKILKKFSKLTWNILYSRLLLRTCHRNNFCVSLFHPCLRAKKATSHTIIAGFQLPSRVAIPFAGSYTLFSCKLCRPIFLFCRLTWPSCRVVENQQFRYWNWWGMLRGEIADRAPRTFLSFLYVV